MSITKKCALEFIFFHKKKLRKIRIIFDKKIDFVKKFWHFLTPLH